MLEPRKAIASKPLRLSLAALAMAATASACANAPPPEPTAQTSPTEAPPTSTFPEPFSPASNLLTLDGAATGIPATVRYPDTMAVTSSSSSEGVGIFFRFEPQNNALDEAAVDFFLPAGVATVAEFEPLITGANGLIANNGWTQVGEGDRAEFPYGWVEKVISFSAEGDRAGIILLGQQGGQAIQAVLRQPTEMADIYWSAVKPILSSFQLQADLVPISSSNQAENPLAGTEWRLVEIQSVDDATGTTVPEDPSLYTLRLNADGTVNMRLNCNRATGTWSANASSNGESGSFEFGPLATTKALCPPPSLDAQIARDAEFVRSYLLQDGKLFLSLFADGGIYAWEPNNPQNKASAASFETEPDAELEAAILQASPEYTRELVEISSSPARYLYSRVDLNDDGKEEVLAYMLGSIFCGSGGCNLLLFTEADLGYALVDTFPLSRTPIVVSPEKTNGWSDLFKLESGGGAPASYLRYAFDGRQYVEQERLPADPAPAGKQHFDLAGDFTLNDGIPLQPEN